MGFSWKTWVTSCLFAAVFGTALAAGYAAVTRQVVTLAAPTEQAAEGIEVPTAGLPRAGMLHPQSRAATVPPSASTLSRGKAARPGKEKASKAEKSAKAKPEAADGERTKKKSK